ncbi:C-type lectin domain family 4 member A isoform X4 [Eptesicus fuscus]|uniref:C-type lectin domain family 4 member A isoform X4 n=1 Tax=Eptesicus fuscus TaxID=29078 RepID=UPI002404163D|nr:C-type lectin domain family 4 member A isoform X4 [Eptesicus fuscus]
MDVLRKRYQGFFEESRRSLLNMTSEITYAEVKFKNESTSLGTKSEPSAEKDWSCCPKNWKPFNLNCYFISNDTRNWTESKNNCSAMKSHLLVINTKEEQDFIIGNLDEKSAYYVGLSDPEGNGAWQWVDQTPYNASATFWRPGEPNSLSEHCVILNKPPRSSWGWNDVTCKELHRSICKMMKIYL